MLTQYYRKTTQSELRIATLITWIAMQYIYTRNNTYQDFNKLNQKTYRFQKLKFPIIRTKITNKPIHRLDLHHRTETVPKPYRNTKKRTLRYGLENEKFQ